MTLAAPHGASNNARKKKGCALLAHHPLRSRFTASISASDWLRPSAGKAAGAMRIHSARDVQKIEITASNEIIAVIAPHAM